MIVNDELERMWKEADVAYFKAGFQDLSERAEKLHEDLHSRYLIVRPIFEPGTL
jgi:hypothetical protein